MHDHLPFNQPAIRPGADPPPAREAAADDVTGFLPFTDHKHIVVQKLVETPGTGGNVHGEIVTLLVLDTAPRVRFGGGRPYVAFPRPPSGTTGS